MSVHPCPDKTAADWLLASDCDWFDLVTSGSTGFEAYARLRFIRDPAFPGEKHSDVDFTPDGPGPTELWQLAVAVEHLATHTATPDNLYFLIWDGWPGSYDTAGAAQVLLKDDRFGVVRRYHLFTGDSDLFSWETHSPRASPRSELPDPAFTWPADRAWCIADDIDPHFATIAATLPAIYVLGTENRIDVTPPEDRTVGPPLWF
ncbi:hypothetical protein [Williamsia serinedens]|uniref:Uncharacterized protein n=1 Tax=Williamsia serinedens TaxID=391736 RepID=A0ABT1GWZ9_9NOCA|nr:hypothetical protein [Williamsia serinedens]MCP2159406.1 hypothetical protein [Williamsia serinedens]